jgi:pectinesterase inhibitor-like protein
MESPLGFVPTLFFASVLLFISSPSTKASTQFVETVCSQTINNSECLKALESDPQTASASNYKDIAPSALDLAIVNAKDSYAFINNLIKTNPSEAAR